MCQKVCVSIKVKHKYTFMVGSISSGQEMKMVFIEADLQLRDTIMLLTWLTR